MNEIVKLLLDYGADIRAKDKVNNRRTCNNNNNYYNNSNNNNYYYDNSNNNNNNDKMIMIVIKYMSAHIDQSIRKMRKGQLQKIAQVKLMSQMNRQARGLKFIWNRPDY